ncbi:21194_t:CDS:2 [Gigaspora margarita]|uniref:21194_t:CDS:1 n=1 Tax=Gigaspora margarita TaxID=4874 RepID=A0ABN7VMN0_GIGMA|nr:21194_t:CDS:2 [Gigaspora margarita]
MAHSSSSNDVGQYLDKTEAVEKSLTSLEPIFIASKRSTLIQREGSYRKERDCLINETRTLIFENKDRIKQFEYENSRLHISDPNYELHRRRHEFLRENLQMQYKNIELTIAELAALLKELHLQAEEQDQNIVQIEENTEKAASKLEKQMKI